MNAKAPTPPGDIRRFLDIIWQPGEVREIRILDIGRKNGKAAGYFDDPVLAAEAAAKWDARGNVYVTLNPVDPSLLARAKNRIIEWPKHATADSDIVRRHWLFLDIDAVKPSGISATEDQVAAAKVLLERVTFSLTEKGWPDPVTCMSGNGCHALYRIDLPNTPESLALVQSVLTSLHQRFSSNVATIDTAVGNASRIIGLVGTTKMKGDPTKERPHRRSQVLFIPGALLVVEEGKLQALADQVSTPASPPRTSGGVRAGRTETLKDILDRHGLDYREQPADANGVIWYHVQRCPFHDDGQDYECGVGQKLPDGTYAGHCFHPEGAGKGWQEWKRALGIAVGRNHHNRAMVRTENEDTSTPTFPRTDAGNGELFAHLNGDQVRHDHRRHHWLIWDGHHWREDLDGEIRRLAIEAARYRYHLADAIPDLTERQLESKFAIGSENRQRLDAMLGEAKNLPPLAADGEHWDQDPWLLGVGNGVLDLRTGQVRPGRPEDNITCFTDVPYDPDAVCPRWRSFLDEVFQGDEDLIDFVVKAVGYSLTGITTEQCLFLCYGRGANGKSLFLAILRALLGLYAYNAPFSTFELKARSDISNDVAALAGRRLVTAAETNDSTRLNEARVKALTGCDPLTARYLYGEHFTFRPVAKFFLAANHLPQVADTGFGFWRRVRLLPFLRQFTLDADTELEAKLRQELPGILTWALQGCLTWQASDLTPPATVVAATQDYREKSDALADFVAQELMIGPERWLGSTAAYTRYKSWAQTQGMSERETLTMTAFATKMGDRFDPKRKAGARGFVGVGLVGDPVQEVLA